MNICKHYVNGNCTSDNCKFKHVDNICKNYFFKECTRNNCKFNHEFKLKTKIKNTETAIPNHNEPNIRIRFNEVIKASNEISIVNNIFYERNLFNSLLNEVNEDTFKKWHLDSHLIADDKTNWKIYSPTFNIIIDRLCDYFKMIPSATRLNYYKDASDWKPYHHDAAALKPEKASNQNITVGASFGFTREISFESTHKNINDRLIFNFPLNDCTIYAFGNDVNINFRHGIPQVEQETFNNNKYERISVIIWGNSQYLKKKIINNFN